MDVLKLRFRLNINPLLIRSKSAAPYKCKGSEGVTSHLIENLLVITNYIIKLLKYICQVNSFIYNRRNPFLLLR